MNCGSKLTQTSAIPCESRKAVQWPALRKTLRRDQRARAEHVLLARLAELGDQRYDRGVTAACLALADGGLTDRLPPTTAEGRWWPSCLLEGVRRLLHLVLRRGKAERLRTSS